MKLSVQKAVENYTFCRNTGRCTPCTNNYKRALVAISKGKKYITI